METREIAARAFDRHAGLHPLTHTSCTFQLAAEGREGHLQQRTAIVMDDAGRIPS